MFFCLGLVITITLMIILIFTYYISVAKGLDFRKRFLEMASLSLGTAVVTFFIGYAVRQVFGMGEV